MSGHLLQSKRDEHKTKKYTHIYRFLCQACMYVPCRQHGDVIIFREERRGGWGPEGAILIIVHACMYPSTVDPKSIPTNTCTERYACRVSTSSHGVSQERMTNKTPLLYYCSYHVQQSHYFVDLFHDFEPWFRESGCFWTGGVDTYFHSCIAKTGTKVDEIRYIQRQQSNNQTGSNSDNAETSGWACMMSNVVASQKRVPKWTNSGTAYPKCAFLPVPLVARQASVHADTKTFDFQQN